MDGQQSTGPDFIERLLWAQASKHNQMLEGQHYLDLV